MSKPDTKHPDYAGLIAKARVVADFMDSELVKDATTDYLKKPIAIIGKAKETQMYQTYLDNAFFPESILPDTLAEMLGMVFKTPLDIKLPAKIAHLESHADNSGNSLEAVFRDVVAGVLKAKRHAIASDYDGAQSYLALYKSADIINWDKNSHGYTLLVLREQYESGGDEYQKKYSDQLREYRLVDGVLEVHVWREVKGQYVEYFGEDGEGFTPELPKSQQFDFIPVRIPEVDKIPLYGMAADILKGYQVSADYYGMLYNIAFGTLVISSSDDVTKVETGLHTGLKLGADGKAEILTLGSDGAAPLKDAMMERFDSAVKQGVRIIEGGAQKESGEALYIRAASKQVKLQDIVNECAEKMKEALRVCAMLENANPDEVEFSATVELIDKPFDKDKMAELRSGVESGLVKWSDYIMALVINDLASVPVNKDGMPDYEQYRAELIAEARELSDV